MFSLSMLLSLPTDLSGAIVGNLLPLKDIVGLDSAVCERAQREVLLTSVLRSPTCVVCKIPDFFSDENIKWIYRKGIRTKEVILYSEDHLNIFEDYLNEVGEQVVDLTLCSHNEERACRFVSLCTNL